MYNSARILEVIVKKLVKSRTYNTRLVTINDMV